MSWCRRARRCCSAALPRTLDEPFAAARPSRRSNTTTSFTTPSTWSISGGCTSSRCWRRRRASLQADLTAARTRYLARNGGAVGQAGDAGDAGGGRRPTSARVDGAARAAARAESFSRCIPRRSPKAIWSDARSSRRSTARSKAVTFTHGQLKYENDKLFTILDLSRVWVEARFPEEAAVSRRPPARMRFASPRSRTCRSRVGWYGSPIRSIRRPERCRRFSKCRIPTACSVSACGCRRSDRSPDAAASTGTQGQVRNAVGDWRRRSAQLGPVSLTAVVKAKPELRAEVAAPLWGRIDFARPATERRRLTLPRTRIWPRSSWSSRPTSAIR